MTLTPAEILGVANKVGRIEKGKKANFVLADGDIFEYGTHVTQTVVNGKLAGVDSRYTSLYERFKNRR